MRRLFTSISFFLVFSTSIFAQNQTLPAESSDQDINYTLNVTADRLQESVEDKSDSISVISKEEIERHQWRYVIDAVRDVPGLAVAQSGSAGKTASVFVRGASANQVLVLIDGVQINDPYFGDIYFEDLTTDNVERIEILKSPQSPLYGSDSIGGVINIITQKGQPGFHPSLDFEGGSLQTFCEKANVSGGQENVTYALGLSRVDTQGQVENDELRESSFFGNVDYQWNTSTKFQVTGRLHDAHTGIPFNSFYQPALERNQDEKLSLIGTTLQHSSGSYFDSTTRFAWTHVNFLFEDPEDPFASLNKHNSNVFQAGFQNNFHLTDSDVLTAGYEFESQRITASDAGGPVPDLDGFDTTNHGVYAQNKVETKHWIVTGGIRYDHHSTFGETTNPRISIAYRPDENWKLRGSAGTGFRAPTAGDLAYPFYGNPNLKPETSKSWEFGADRGIGEAITISGTWFKNLYRDLITFDPNTFLAANVARAKSQGLELGATIELGGWHIAGAYTYLDTEDEIQQHDLLRRPKNSGSFRLAYDSYNWGGSIRVLGVGDRLDTDFRVSPSVNVFTPGYSRTDVAGYYRLNAHIKVHGRIENLFNADYQEVLTFPAPGISFFGGVEFGM